MYLMVSKTEKLSSSGPAELICAVQNYEWGLRGNESLVAQIYAKNNLNPKIEAGKPYAELWMGTHVSGPSKIKGEDNLSLKDYLKGQDLPFLFKVLSVRTALSIQAHPDRILAEKLHASDPKNYRDANHKPEMAIALGEFEALCGFRPVETITEFAREYRGFSELIGGIEVIEKSIQKAFENLMNRSSEQVKKAIEMMPTEGDKSYEIIRLFHRLNRQYPGDVGIFCVFFLNHFKLQSGEAVFLAANEPHAYLHGNCIECMATSDNVVRAGLTPKHRDVEVLCSMLTYKTFSGLKDLLTIPQKLTERLAARIYKSPVPEFSVLQVALKAKNDEDECINSENLGKSILICTQGALQLEIGEVNFNLELGSIIYLPEKCKYKLKNLYEGESVIYQAFEPLNC